MDNFLLLESRRTGEMSCGCGRSATPQGQTILTIDGSLPPKASGPPLPIPFNQREEGVVKAGSLGAQIGNENY